MRILRELGFNQGCCFRCAAVFRRNASAIGDIASRQRITENNAENVSAAAMIEELRQDNLKLVASLREVKELVDDAKDNATSGILDDWTDQAEERAWFLLETGKAG